MRRVIKKSQSMAIQFDTVGWANGAVIYEANIRQYTTEGNFKAFAKHLPRLKDMGVDIIWLMPITPISLTKRQGSLGSYYACSSYTKINEEFGTLDDFKSFINQAHQLGLKVIIDWVANHTGYDHEWTVTKKDFYILNEYQNFTERNGWNDVIDLNYCNAEMRAAMQKAMQYWILECDIDGFRCDMAHLVPLDFWEEARRKCDTIKPLYWLAECDTAEYLNVFDTSYAWQWMHNTEKLVKGENSVHDIYNTLHQYSNYTTKASKLFFTSNHDENSWNGTEYEKYGKLAKAFAVFSFTWLGTPLVYSGQEIPNKKRLKFFEKDEIDWNTEISLNEFYSKLSALHKTELVLKGETFILPASNNVMAFMRRYNNQTLLVLLNLTQHDRVNFRATHEWLTGNFVNVMSGMQFSFNGSCNFELMNGEYLIYKSF